MSECTELARGKWPELLGQWLTERTLANRHGPCPMCGGKDRFRFDNIEGMGTWICSHCGAGDGFHLLQNINDWSFAQALDYVKVNCGKFDATPGNKKMSAVDIRANLRRVWDGSVPIKSGDPAYLYLIARLGNTFIIPRNCLRYHPSLKYRHDDGSVTTHPALLAQVSNGEGRPVTIHRTYLTEDGRKSDLVNTPRKLMTPIERLHNVAIRLAPPIDGWLGVAEGIETALCASARYEAPVWACVSAGLLESFRPPPGIKLLTVFGDNDYSFTGQAAAYKLARSIAMLDIECRVCIPDEPGTDWADAQNRG